MDYSTYSLCRMICDSFEIGEVIGLTFISDGVASIATGEYMGMEGCIIKIKNLLMDDTMSYVPLNDISSVEKGIILNKNPISIKLK